MKSPMRTFSFCVNGSEDALRRFFDASRAYQNKHNGKCLITSSAPIDDEHVNGWCMKGYEVRSDQPELLTLIATASGVECYEKLNRDREREVRKACFEKLPRYQREIAETVANIIEHKYASTAVPSDMFVGLAEAWERGQRKKNECICPGGGHDGYDYDCPIVAHRNHPEAFSR